jgi:hypothetical protein
MKTRRQDGSAQGSARANPVRQPIEGNGAPVSATHDVGGGFDQLHGEFLSFAEKPARRNVPPAPAGTDTEARRPWQPWEIELLGVTYPIMPTALIAKAFGRTVYQVYNKAGALGLKKTEDYLASPDACRLRRGDNVGKAHRFLKGHVPANKGKKGWCPEGCKPTQFKPGHRGGRALEKYQPIGTERISKDGYLERKINDDMPFQRRWRAVHLLVWEAANGPLPAGHAIAFKDGNKQNIDLANLELISRRELMRRNTIHNYPREIVEVTRLRAVITRQIHKHERKSA